MLELRQIFTVTWPFNQRNFQIVDFTLKTERRVNKVGKKKDLRRQTKEWRAVCLTTFREIQSKKLFMSIIIKHEG